MNTTLRKDDKVYDRWWPERLGKVIQIRKTRLRVQWSGGDVWSYDLPHLGFLVKE